MYRIKKLNSISDVVCDYLCENHYEIKEDLSSYEAILVRSAKCHGMSFPSEMVAIARAGAGVNNIPIDECTKQGIVVFNTPGANANGVKELVLAGMLIASRNVIEAVAWAKTLSGKGEEVLPLVEKGKNQFVGPELSEKTLGVVGLGAIGVMVANAAHALA
jgi:D-3-phosphoglycerate dehydrogenase